MKRTLWIFSLVVLLWAPACRKQKVTKAQSGPASGSQPLVSAATLQQLEREVLAQVEQNRTRSCPRPVLHGEATAGKADEALVALIKPGPGTPLASCLARAEGLKKELSAAVGTEQAPEGELAKLVAQCEPLYAAVSKAARHEDACSPYLAGRRGMDRAATLIASSKVIALRMRALAAAGKRIQAARLGLDLVRVTQDIHRGEGAPMVAGIVGKVAAQNVLAGGLRPLLDGWKGKDAAAPLAEVARQLRVLEQSEPPFGQMLRYETTGFVLQSLLPRLKGEKWIPPGGFEYAVKVHPAAAAKQQKKNARIKARRLRGVSERDELALVWLSSSDTIELLIAACPASATAEACAAAMKRASMELHRESPKTRLARMLELRGSKKPTQVIRGWILDVLRAVGAPPYHKYMGRHAGRSFFLRATRVHALVAAQRARSGRCPDLTADGAATSFPLEDPATGRELHLKKTPNGVQLQPPAAAAGRPLGHYYRLKYVVQCP